MPVDALFLDQNEDFGHSDNWTPNLPANFGGNVYGVESTQVIQPWTGGAQGL